MPSLSQIPGTFRQASQATTTIQSLIFSNPVLLSYNFGVPAVLLLQVAQ